MRAVLARVAKSREFFVSFALPAAGLTVHSMTTLEPPSSAGLSIHVSLEERKLTCVRPPLDLSTSSWKHVCGKGGKKHV